MSEVKVQRNSAFELLRIISMLMIVRVIVNCCGLKKSVFFIRQPSFVHRPQKLYFWRQVQVV